jgi:hypothetical protein
VNGTVKRHDTLALVECKVPGCGWRAEIPTLYRFEHVAEPMTDVPRPAFAVDVRVVVDRAAVAAFDAYCAGHAVEHEITETALAHPDDPGPSEPAP